MLCPSCGFDNPEGLRFCGQCAAPVKSACAKCGFENPPGFKFCGQCGTSLTTKPRGKRVKGETAKRKKTTAKSELQIPDSGPSSAERRQLTVMFCDLVGSTALSEQLDPEELREVVRAYQEVCAEVIGRFEGHIAQYLGDGLLVYFGYPVAHEDDAQRAVHAGLGILAALPESPLLNLRLSHLLQVRIGIHTGLVVVGEIGGGKKRENLALGDTPNIAARVQGIAEPDTVVISAATYRLIQGLFECRTLGPHALKGVSAPLEVYHILGESAVRSRLEAAETTGLTPLVGRERERELVLTRWEQAKTGAGQVVSLSGEAGVGKSRLLQVLKEHAGKETHTRLECHCSPYHQNSAFYPVIDLLQRVLQFRREDSPQEKLDKLEGLLTEYGLYLPKVVPLFATLLSLPLLDRYAPLTLTPQRQKQKILEALLVWLLEVAEKQPVLFVMEDLHWMDPSTLEFLPLLMAQGAAARILILLTFRPQFTASWTRRDHLTQIELGRLPREQVEVMVKKVAGGKTLPVEVLQQIIAKTDGVPLFVEELTKMVLESVETTNRSPQQTLAIPATLHDSLMARLDRLTTAREVAQLGATLGREFPYEVIQAVSSGTEETLQHELARLVEAELLSQRGVPPHARYLFKHALIQDAAYQSLLKSTRQQYHQQIARVLAERFPEIRDTQPELLAHHYTEAGLKEEAISYWQQAGQRAIARSANVEAISHLTKGIELVKALPDTPVRVQQELTLQIALGESLMATKGYAAPEVAQAYARARELCRQVGETPQLFPVLFGLWAFYTVREELHTARELGEQILRLAHTVQDTPLMLQAHYTVGIPLFYLGELASAREHLEQGIALYDRHQHPAYAFRAVQDPGVLCLSYAAWVLWLLGYPDQALRRSHEALALAQELSHPFSLAFALSFTARLHQYRREGQVTCEQAQAAITLATEQEFPFWVAQGTILWGWALTTQGQGEEGIAQLHQGMAAYRAAGAELSVPYWLALLAEACGHTGQMEEGLRVLAEALVMANRSGEQAYAAELYRLTGQLVLQSGVCSPESELPNTQHPTPSTQAEAEAEVCFLKAIEIARGQQAKSLELRAVISLGRLWQQQEKTGEARQMLAEIYNWFTEGFDTADLQEAKVLLEELGH